MNACVDGIEIETTSALKLSLRAEAFRTPFSSSSVS